MDFFKNQTNKENTSLENNDDSNNEPAGKVNESKEMHQISADLERLKAQAEANTELRQIFTEKFSRIDEQFGEFRRMFIERDKEVHEIDFKATKAADLVAEVRPENITKDVKKFDLKLEALKAKMESSENINERIISELKDLRNSVRTFKGVEEIQRMNKELSEDQLVIKKIEARVEQHAEKTESMYLDMNKKYNDYMQLKEVTETTNSNFKRIEKEFAEFKIKYQNIASKEKELAAVDTRLISAEKGVEQIKNLNSQFNNANIKFSDLSENLKRVSAQIKMLNRENEFIKNENVSLRRNIEQNFKEDAKRTQKLEKFAELLSIKQKVDVENFKMTEKRLLNYAINKTVKPQKQSRAQRSVKTRAVKQVKAKAKRVSPHVKKLVLSVKTPVAREASSAEDGLRKAANVSSGGSEVVSRIVSYIGKRRRELTSDKDIMLELRRAGWSDNTIIDAYNQIQT